MSKKKIHEIAEEKAFDYQRNLGMIDSVSDDHVVARRMGFYDGFIAGVEWQEKRNEETIKTAEDHAFLAGADWQKEKIIKLIQSRIAEILGDAQPNPILRVELHELIEKIK